MKLFIRTILIILFPFLVLLVWVRIMLFPIFVQVEYPRPGFPPDVFGFTTQERIHWAEISANYLLSREGPNYFSQFTLPGGSPLYNEREMKHMADVQHSLLNKIVHIGHVLHFALVVQRRTAGQGELRKIIGPFPG